MEFDSIINERTTPHAYAAARQIGEKNGALRDENDRIEITNVIATLSEEVIMLVNLCARLESELSTVKGSAA